MAKNRVCTNVCVSLQMPSIQRVYRLDHLITPAITLIAIINISRAFSIMTMC